MKDELEMIAGAKAGRLWALRTPHAISMVQSEGYFSRFASHGLQPGDRIMVSANSSADLQCAWATVMRVHEGEVSVAW